MALTLTAAISQFRGETNTEIKRRLNNGVQAVIEAAQTPQAPASQTGGSFEVGKIAVDTAELINSLHLGEENVGAGQIGTIEAGTVQTFEWRAPYAARHHFGFVGQDALGRSYEQQGRFYLTANMHLFQEEVEK